MARTAHEPDVSEFQPELHRYTVEEAERDADRVGRLLRTLGFAPPPGKVLQLPADFLLNLAAGLRLYIWDRTENTAHRGAGLPSGLDAMKAAFRDLIAKRGKRSRPNSSLRENVFDVMIDKFAWTAQRNLQTEIQLDDSDEDALVEEMAQFLWSHRHDKPAVDQGQTP